MRGVSNRTSGWAAPLVLLVVMAVAGFGAALASADELPPECVVSAESLQEARALYSDSCTLPRIDCDRVDTLWYCSSRVIGKVAPGGVRPEDVGGSDVGTNSTIVVTTTTTTEPPLPTSEPPTTEQPPTSEPPTTDSPPTTEPPSTTEPPVTTEPPASTSTTGGPGGEGTVTRTYPTNDGPERNPMKGWNSGWSDDRPESTVGFQYIKWKDLEPRNGQFDFGAVENIISRSGSEGRHVVLRLYCDWFGQDQQSRGCPDWIYSEVGVERIKGDNGRYITDYNDPRYVEQAIQAIQALAGRYDDDPRMYAFQIGVLGYWGEWHTWSSQVNGRSYEITTDTKSQILDAYRESFDRTHLMGRYPYRDVLSTADDIGFHNDYFRPNNGHSAKFDNSVASEQRWLGGPIGGEVPPGLSSDDYHHMYATSQGREMIERGRYSTMKPSSVDDKYRDAHMKLHKRFGYNYQITRATFTNSSPGSGSVDVDLSVSNVGIAPFYYDWEVQFALLGGDGRVASSAEAQSHDLRTLMPGGQQSFAGSVDLDGVKPGTYRLAARITQPGADEVKSSPWKLDARNTYVLFANDLPVIDGQWGSDNQLVGGWSVLGTTEVR